MLDSSKIGKLRRRLRRYLGRYLGRAEDAEDVAQESFVRVLEAAAKGEIRYPQAYLYRTARNLAFNLKSRKFNQVEDSLEDSAFPDVMDDSEAGPEARVMAQRRFELFCRAAASPPPQCRRLQIIDPNIAKVRIGEYFETGQIEPFLEALDTGFGIKHRRIAEDLTVLSLHKPSDGGTH